MKNRHTVQTPGTPVSRVDSEMSDILDLKNIDDSEKWKMFQEAFVRFLAAKNFENVQAPSKEPNDAKTEEVAPVSEDAVLATVPSKYQAKAKMLVRALQNLPSQTFAWDENGAVTINGEKVPNSNIVDLVNEAMRSRKTSNPPGRHQFAVLLRAANIPREYVGNRELWSIAAHPGKAGHTLSVPNPFKSDLSGSEVSQRSAPSSVVSSDSESEYQSGNGRKRRKTGPTWSRLK